MNKLNEMNEMCVILKNYVPLHIAAGAIRKCWDSGDKSDSQCWDDMYSDQKEWIETGPKDMELIERIGNKFKHASTLEHLVYNFEIKGISRACLQELARHRMASLSVKSTRYTLKELKNEEHFLNGWCSSDTFEQTDWNENGYERASKYLVMTGDFRVDICSIGALDNLRDLLQMGISNDIAKYALVENYKTELAWTINARSLQNFLYLRTDKSALWEIRKLAREIYNRLPDDHKYLFKDFVKLEEK